VTKKSQTFQVGLSFSNEEVTDKYDYLDVIGLPLEESDDYDFLDGTSLLQDSQMTRTVWMGLAFVEVSDDYHYLDDTGILQQRQMTMITSMGLASCSRVR